MPVVTAKENEPFEATLRRFKRDVEKNGLMSEAKRRRYHEPDSVAKKKAKDRLKKLLERRRREAKLKTSSRKDFRREKGDKRK